MRVLQINTVCGTGSTGRIATDIDKMLKEKGHESYIAYGRNEAKDCDTAIRIGSKLDNYTHVAITRIFDRHGFGSKVATRKFIEEVKALDPDIIHLHNIHGYYINIEILFEYLKEANKPVVWTLHDCWTFTGHCAYFDFVGCDKWKTGCNKCPEKEVYPSSRFVDNSKNNYIRKKEVFQGVDNLTIVTPSKWLGELVEESFLKEYQVEVINNGIDLGVFKPVKSDFKKKNNIESKFVILGLASIWDRRKGMNYFVDLSYKLNNEEIIVLVGLTEKQKKSLPGNIIGITRTNNINELAEIYSAADVFVNPTLEDNFPTTNMEALACGTPVITFDTGGSMEIIDEKSGVGVERGNINELLLEIGRIKQDMIAEKCCIDRSSIFEKRDRFIEYIELYDELLSQGEIKL